MVEWSKTNRYLDPYSNVVQQRLEMSLNNARMHQKTLPGCNLLMVKI